MNNLEITNAAPALRYVAYDKTNGRIVGEHSRYSSTEQKYIQMDARDVRNLLSKDKSLVADLARKDPADLGILEVGPGSPPRPHGPAMVDTASGRLVAQPRLSLTTARHQITGDGADSAVIEIKVLDHDGHVKHDFRGPVKVTTTRGRLSARGGVLDVEGGHASITLTSVAETVARVQVSATATAALCAPGSVLLEFL